MTRTLIFSCCIQFVICITYNEMHISIHAEWRNVDPKTASVSRRKAKWMRLDPLVATVLGIGRWHASF